MMPAAIVTGRSSTVDRGLPRVVVIASLLVAVVVVPWPLASWLAVAQWPGPGSLARAVADALALDWRSGAVPAGSARSALAGPTRFWQAFHLVKSVLSLGLLAASVRALVQSWAPPAVGDVPGRFGRRVGGLAALACAGVALVLCIANLQGAIAPLTSVLGFLPEATPAASQVAGALREALADGASAPAAEAIVTDFARYHLALAALGALAALALAGLAVLGWRRHRLIEGVALGLAVAALGIVVAANIGTWLHPVPALDAFLAGVPAR